MISNSKAEMVGKVGYYVGIMSGLSTIIKAIEEGKVTTFDEVVSMAEETKEEQIKNIKQELSDMCISDDQIYQVIKMIRKDAEK